MGLLLLLRLPWPVWGAEAFQGEWECAARSLSGMEGRKSPGVARARRTGHGEGLGESLWELPRDSQLQLCWPQGDRKSVV